MINHSDLFEKYFSMSKTQAIQQEKPIAILTVGEESSGKEVITAQAQDELSHRGGSILIDPSLITVADPQQNEDEKSKKINELIDKASSEKYNLVINQDYKDENEIDKLSSSLKAKGYEIDVRSISAPQEIIEHRDSSNKFNNIEDKIEKTASAILHEDKTGLILKHLEDTDHIDKISIYDRVGNEVYSNEKNPDGETWLKQKEAYNIYNFEKNKPLAKSEAEYILLAQHQLREIKNSHTIINEQNNQIVNDKEIKKLELTLEKPKYIRESKNYKDVQRGIVVENNEDRLVLKINNTVGISYDPKELSKDQKQFENIRLGQELHINHSANQPEIMNDQEIMDYHLIANQTHDIGLEHNR